MIHYYYSDPLPFFLHFVCLLFSIVYSPSSYLYIYYSDYRAYSIDFSLMFMFVFMFMLRLTAHRLALNLLLLVSPPLSALLEKDAYL